MLMGALVAEPEGPLVVTISVYCVPGTRPVKVTLPARLLSTAGLVGRPFNTNE